MKPSCAICKFKVEWNPAHAELATCARMPPQLISGLGEGSGLPQIAKNRIVCGEYKRRRFWHRMPTQWPPLPPRPAPQTPAEAK